MREVEPEPAPCGAPQKLPCYAIDRVLDTEGEVGCPGNGTYPGFEQPGAERRRASVYDGDPFSLRRCDEFAEARSEETERFVPFGRVSRRAGVLSEQGFLQPIPIEERLHLGLTCHTQRSPTRGMPGRTAKPDGKLVHLAHGQGAMVRAVPADASGERRDAGASQVAVAEPIVAVGLQSGYEPVAVAAGEANARNAQELQKLSS